MIPQRSLRILPLAVAGVALSIPQTGRADELETVVVTAQKRSESLQSVPVAVTDFKDADLQNKQIVSVVDLGDEVPNLEATKTDQGGSNVNFYIRGIGQNDFISTDDPGVGVYLDGVYIARTAGGLLDLGDISDVEILRGPQGTLFGKNTIGGAVLVTTHEPTFDLTGDVEGRFGERSRMDFSGVLNVPLVDNVAALRISFTDRNQDGYAHSLYDNQDEGSEHHGTLRASFLWLPADSWKVLASADWTHTDQEEIPAYVTDFAPNTFVTGPQNAWAIANGVAPWDQRWATGNPFQNYSGFHPGNKGDVWGTSLTVTKSFSGEAQLKSIFAYRQLDDRTGLDYGGSPTGLGNQNVDVSQNQVSEELIFTDSFLDGRLNLVSGLFFMHEDGRDDILLDLVITGNTSGIETDTLNLFEGTTYAGYGQLSYKLTDALDFDLGARYSYEDKDDTISVFSLQPPPGFDVITPMSQTHGWYSLTYRAAANYKITEDAMVYASIATGFKSGGFNGRPNAGGDFNAYGPEKATTYEVGTKADFFDKSLRVDLAGFYTEYDDIQEVVNATDPFTGAPLNLVENAAKATMKGIELEATWAPVPRMKLNLGTGYLYSAFDEIAPGAAITLSNKLPSTPRWTLNAGAQYTVPLGTFGDLLARADVSWVDRFYWQVQSTPLDQGGNYALVNAILTYTPPKGNYQVSFYGKNLFDRTYFTYADDLSPFAMALAIPGEPRELGVLLRYEW
ncbi:MAG TPA: TonB-dependent receptor [Stellaceae bacterium]|nr:TonB-dependent receptor [Stellaceae bacterium]